MRQLPRTGESWYRRLRPIDWVVLFVVVVPGFGLLLWYLHGMLSLSGEFWIRALLSQICLATLCVCYLEIVWLVPTVSKLLMSRELTPDEKRACIVDLFMWRAWVFPALFAISAALWLPLAPPTLPVATLVPILFGEIPAILLAIGAVLALWGWLRR